MSYSIMTPFKNKEDKKRMENFMKGHFRSLKEITKGLKIEDFEPGEGVQPNDELSYGSEHHQIVLGFDYGAAEFDEERDYYFTICYWMAVKLGDKKTFKEHEDTPYVIYDGYEEWALFVEKERNKEIESMEVDEHGYRPLNSLQRFKDASIVLKASMRKMKKEWEMIDEAIQKELKRLTEEWERANK